jgi:hypothetical protein
MRRDLEMATPNSKRTYIAMTAVYTMWLSRWLVPGARGVGSGGNVRRDAAW